MLESILPWLSGGLIGGIIGGFLGGFTKFFWEKWLPDWMTWRREQKIDREKLMAKYRAPAIRAIYELQSRLYVIVNKQAGNYIYTKKTGSGEYYIDSTAYLVAQCLAWVEILRTRMGFFDYYELIIKLDELSESIAKGDVGFQIFKLEQQEIAERMLGRIDSEQIVCIQYSDFLELSDTSPAWYSNLREKAEEMLDGWPGEIRRVASIQHALVDVINFMDPEAKWVRKDRRQKLDIAKEIEALENNA